MMHFVCVGASFGSTDSFVPRQTRALWFTLLSTSLQTMRPPPSFVPPRDVFGNLLNSLLGLDFEPFPKPPKKKPPSGGRKVPPAEQPEEEEDPQAQYRLDRVLRELNKAYVGFYCQQDRGDISTELLALTVKRGSLAFVAEDYPECGAPLNVTSRQSDLGNVNLSTGGGGGANEGWSIQDSVGQQPKVPPPVVVLDPPGPLSPIQEVSDSPSFSSFLAGTIIQSSLEAVQGGGASAKPAETKVSGEEEMASKLMGSLFGTPSEGRGSGEAMKDLFNLVGDPRPQNMDELAISLTSSIVTETVANAVPKPDIVVISESGLNLEARSNSLALSIISDVLASEEVCPATPPLSGTPQSVGEASVGSSPSEDMMLTNMAAELSGNILSGAIEDCSHAPPPATLGGVANNSEGGFPGGEQLNEFITDVANEAIRVAISSVQERGSVVSSTDFQSVPSSLDVLASNIAMESVVNGVQGSVGKPSLKKQLVGGGGLSDNMSDSEPELSAAASAGGSAVAMGVVGGGGNLNSRLLTPVSMRTGYAWSIASTRDEDSRPVSPTDLNNIGLSLSNNTEEFSSLFSNILISNAISNVTGENLSPNAISAEKKAEQDLVSLPRSTKIGKFLSTLNEAEPPLEGGVSPYNSTWQNMRRQLLRPVATGYHRESGGKSRGDPQLRAIIQWMAASASARPRLFYYSLKEESVKDVSCNLNEFYLMHFINLRCSEGSIYFRNLECPD